METVTWHLPELQIRSDNSSEYDGCFAWSATASMYPEGEYDSGAERVVGHCSFLTIRLGDNQPISWMLDQFDSDCLLLAPLFDGGEVDPTIVDDPESAGCVDALLIRSVHIAEPFRGHDLGLWLVSEVLFRMARPFTFVALAAASMKGDQSASDRRAAANRLASHWERLGLTRVASIDSEEAVIMTGNGSYEDFDRARQQLTLVNDLSVAAPPDSLPHLDGQS